MSIECDDRDTWIPGTGPSSGAPRERFHIRPACRPTFVAPLRYRPPRTDPVASAHSLSTGRLGPSRSLPTRSTLGRRPSPVRLATVRWLPRKEVIQPQLPLRLPCYDFVPIIRPTLDGCPPRGLAHRLQVLPTFVT